MTIKLKQTDSGINIPYQNPTHPIVYLDNSTINLLYNNKIRDDFVTILNEKKGTIAISKTGLSEISNRSDSNQTKDICSFLDKMYIVYIDDNAPRVINGEKNINYQQDVIYQTQWLF